jgi:malonyl-CoA/methylmalonyl-CoA synthetase
MAIPDWLAGERGEDARNLAELFVHRMDGRRMAFACDDGRTFTFNQFWKLAGQLKGQLAALGAKPGDRIAVQCAKSIEVVALFWACARGGFIFLPLNTAYTQAEVSYFVEDAEPAVLVCGPGAEPEARGARVAHLAEGGLAGVEAIAGADHLCDWDSIAAILYTSGTTGRSKGAMLSHGNLASNGLALIAAWGITADDILIHSLPVYHTHGLFTATNTLLLAGGQMLFRRSFDAEDVIKLMGQATMLMGVPTFYTRILQNPRLDRAAVSRMRLFISGSAPLLAETHRTFAQRTGHAILERYGMTETSMNTSNPLDGERRAGTVGFPLPGVALRITDLAGGGAVAAGETGMIELRGPNLFRGYWRNPEKTAEDMAADGFFRTGDVGRFDENGYLHITGRAKDMVITGGFNVYPKEVEALIDLVPGVLESAVIGVSHADFGEGVTAVVVRAEKADVSEADVMAALAPQLAKFKMPKRVIFVESLPRNAMGKVQKAVLREKYQGIYLPV